MNASLFGKLFFLMAVVAISAYLLYADEKMSTAEQFANSSIAAKKKTPPPPPLSTRKSKSSRSSSSISRTDDDEEEEEKETRTTTTKKNLQKKKTGLPNTTTTPKKKKKAKKSVDDEDEEEGYVDADSGARKVGGARVVKDEDDDSAGDDVDAGDDADMTADDDRLDELTRSFNELVKRKQAAVAGSSPAALSSPAPASSSLSSPAPAVAASSRTKKPQLKQQQQSGRLAEDISVQSGQFNAFSSRTECRDDLETQWRKEKYKDLILLPGMEWSIPMKRPPICTVQGGCSEPKPVLDQTALIGTLLEDADMTDNGSIMPDFKCSAKTKY